MRPKSSAGVPVAGWQNGSFSVERIVSATSAPLFSGTAIGRRDRTSLNSAPSRVTTSVTRTMRCDATDSTDPNCFSIQGRISSGGMSVPVVVLIA